MTASGDQATLRQMDLDAVRQEPASGRTLLVQGPWGAAPGAFGRDDEASRPGPMSLTVDRQGRLLVLDQVNRRVQIFERDGSRCKVVPIADATAEDIGVADERIWLLVQPRGGEADLRRAVVELDLDGRELQRARLSRDVALVTGLFVVGDEQRPDVWVELRHRQQIRVAAEGRLLSPAEQQLRRNRAQGRPQRWRPAERQRLLAARTRSRQVTVAALDEQRRLRPLLEVSSSQGIERIAALASDEDGDLYLGLVLPGDQRMMLVAPARRAAYTVELASGPMASDALRRLAVGRDGAIYQLQTDEQGVRVWRWQPGGEAR